MRNLDGVKRFYEQVKIEATFDYAELAEEFENHDVFANPPRFHRVTLPFLGEVELTLIAVQQPDYPNKDLSQCKIATDDGKYHYGSRVCFLAKPTAALETAGFTPATKWGDFAGLVDLTCHQGTHSNLFGHPMEHFGGGHWPKKDPEEFCTENLPEIMKVHLKRFFPKELHQFPFDDGEFVKVFAQDVTKIGGDTVKTDASNAMTAFSRMAEQIVQRERGNANVCGYVEYLNVRWVIPAFGKNHVAFNV